MEKQLIIKPIVKPKFSGISKHAKTFTVINGAQLDRTGLYKTGLTSEEEEKYEKELNLAKGTLNKRSSFWAELDIRLFNDKITYFNIISPLDELKEKVIKNHSLIAPTELEIFKYPNAEFYIEDLEEKAKGEEISLNLEFEALQLLMETSIQEKRGILKVYSGAKGVDTFSETLVKTELMKKVKEDPKRFIEIMNDPDLKTRILIQELIELGKLTKKGTFYSYDGEVVGNSMDSLISFFKDLKNQSIRLIAEQSIKNNKKAK